MRREVLHLVLEDLVDLDILLPRLFWSAVFLLYRMLSSLFFNNKKILKKSSNKVKCCYGASAGAATLILRSPNSGAFLMCS